MLPPQSYMAIKKPAGEQALIDQAAKMLAEAKTPLIHAGSGVLRSGNLKRAYGVG